MHADGYINAFEVDVSMIWISSAKGNTDSHQAVTFHNKVKHFVTSKGHTVTNYFNLICIKE